jgi:hypothetical protein
MSDRLWQIVRAIGLVLLGVAPLSAGQFFYWSGQNVVPVFEGWERNPDGTSNFVFGYYNRNFEETLDIPIGPDNNIEPGGPDQGQPTFFAPGRNKVIFRVKVPANWGKTTRLVWTLTIRGKTEQASAFLLPEWETDSQVIGANAGPGNGSGGGGDPMNKAPTIAVQADRTVKLGDSLTLTSLVTDDGRPRAGRGGGGDRQLGLLRVDWVKYRGPVGGKVTFTPETPLVLNGKAVTHASFSAPGRYVLRGFANDGELRTPADVTVEVGPASESRR